MTVLAHHTTTIPEAPSKMSEESIPPEIDALVLECLAKKPSERPASADVLYERLEALPIANRWDQRAARTWWEMHEPELVGRLN
jgi:hypothetical protein